MCCFITLSLGCQKLGASDDGSIDVPEDGAKTVDNQIPQACDEGCLSKSEHGKQATPDEGTCNFTILLLTLTYVRICITTFNDVCSS